jgi:phage tail-like protein
VTVSALPALHQPPHDPLRLLLGGRLGWPLVEPSALPDDGGTLVLPRFPGSLRLLGEESGSLGGWCLPANAAFGPEGEPWLLTGARLLRFDPCACGFEETGWCGEEGISPGQLRSPGGITIAAGHLFVCDTGNQRVQVLLLPQLVVSGVWTAPMPWQPTAVVVDRRFRVHVVDPQNGMVHHFGWSGRYLGNTPGVGASRFLGLTADGRLVAAGAGASYLVDGTVVVPLEHPADDLTDLFGGPPPVEVAPNGAMHLGPRCVPQTDGWFDTGGRPVSPPTPPAQTYERSAVCHVGPLDSLIDDCVWDRVALLGDLPPGCTVTVETHNAQVPLSPAELLGLPPQAWETGVTCTALEDGWWDALVRGRPGRFLWLRLRLTGTGTTTPALAECVLDFPRISLRRHLPAVFGAEPTSADFTDRLLAIVDRTLRDVEEELDDLPALFDPRATNRLAWLASWIGITPDPRLPERLQRDVVADAGRLLDLRGTVEGLRRLLLLALGLDDEPACLHVGANVPGCTTCPEPRPTCPPTPPGPSRWSAPPLLLEHFRLRRWFEAGASRLGDQTVLWGQSVVNRSQLGSNAQVGVTALKGTQDPLRDPFHVYAHQFTVFVPASAGRTPERRKAVEGLVAWGSPAHTRGEVRYVDARMRIGIQSSIGLDTVVARMPAGFVLGRTELGAASVLDGADRRSIDNAAIGTTAVLA